MFLELLKSQWVAALIAVGGLIAFVFNVGKLYNWTSAPINRAVLAMLGLSGLKTTIGSLQKSLDYISYELKPNSGTSLRDAINRIESNMTIHEQRLKVLMESDTSQGVMECDKLGNVVWVNRKYCRLAGRTPEELYGTGWFNSLPPNERDKVTAEWLDSVSKGRNFEMDHHLVSPEGVRHAVFARSYVMHGPAGVVGIMKIVTPHKE